MVIFKFEPLYKIRPWGGTYIKNQFNRKIELQSSRIGESWEIVDRPRDQSFVSTGNHKGCSLRQIILNDCHGIMGPNWDPNAAFPILVKWLDCKERLSLQVHPPEEIAKQLGGQPKTENWYIANSTEKAGLFIGFKKPTDKKIFRKALQNNMAESLCFRTNSCKGDSILVESGRIHAIDKGNLILEIQQNSDTTYRVYDWGRVDLNNKPRKLHLEQSLQSINFKDTKPRIIKHTNDLEQIELANCENFRIIKHNLKKGTKFLIKKENIECVLLHLIEGHLKIDDAYIHKGEQIMSPYFSACELTILEDSILLVTDHFVNQQNLDCTLSH
jgi:mannose-6-phosphate isomerase